MSLTHAIWFHFVLEVFTMHEPLYALVSFLLPKFFHEPLVTLSHAAAALRVTATCARSVVLLTRYARRYGLFYESYVVYSFYTHAIPIAARLKLTINVGKKI